MQCYCLPLCNSSIRKERTGTICQLCDFAVHRECIKIFIRNIDHLCLTVYPSVRNAADTRENIFQNQPFCIDNRIVACLVDNTCINNILVVRVDSDWLGIFRPTLYLLALFSPFFESYDLFAYLFFDTPIQFSQIYIFHIFIIHTCGKILTTIFQIIVILAV